MMKCVIAAATKFVRQPTLGHGFATVLMCSLAIATVQPTRLLAAQLVYPGLAPCDTTLQACIEAAATGDTIDIASNDPIDEQISISRSVTLRPAPGFTPVIGASATTRAITFGLLGNNSGDNQRVVIEGITLENARFTGIVRFGSGHEIVLRNNQVMFDAGNNNTAGIDMSLRVPISVLIDGNRITSSGQGIKMRGEGDLATIEVLRNLITASVPSLSNSGVDLLLRGAGDFNVSAINNVIYSVAGCMCGNAGGILLEVSEAATVDATFTHNTLHDIQGVGDGIEVVVDDPGADITARVLNNTVSQAARAGYRINTGASTSDVTVGVNNSFNNAEADFGSAIDGSQTSFDPQFVDPAGGDFRLRKESFLIDAGLSNVALGLDVPDAAGFRRPAGFTVDIGAYEFGGEAPLLYTRREAFEGAPRGQVVSAPYPTGNPGQPFVTGQVSLDTVAPSSFNFSNWPADFPNDNDIELALNDVENLFIRSNNSFPFRGVGIEFDDASGGSSPSTFATALFFNDREVGRLTFRTPNAPLDNFIGVWSPLPFDELRILEMPNANENEFFGRVFVTPFPAVQAVFSDGLEELCPLDDSWEPNDSQAGATAVNVPFARDEFVICDGNNDFYRFTAQESDTATVTVEFLHSDGDINLELLDSAGAVVASSASSTDNEILTYPIPTGETGSYVVRVLSAGGVQNTYALTVFAN